MFLYVSIHMSSNIWQSLGNICMLTSLSHRSGRFRKSSLWISALTERFAISIASVMLVKTDLYSLWFLKHIFDMMPNSSMIFDYLRIAHAVLKMVQTSVRGSSMLFYIRRRLSEPTSSGINFFLSLMKHFPFHQPLRWVSWDWFLLVSLVSREFVSVQFTWILDDALLQQDGRKKHLKGRRETHFRFRFSEIEILFFFWFFFRLFSFRVLAIRLEQAEQCLHWCRAPQGRYVVAHFRMSAT